MTQLTILLFTLLLSCDLYSQVYKDSKAKIEDRINDFISRMSFEEKLGQMQQSTFRRWNDEILNNVRSGRVGSYLNAGILKDKAKIQKVAVEESRLGIPIIFGRDVIHG